MISMDHSNQKHSQESKRKKTRNIKPLFFSDQTSMTYECYEYLHLIERSNI
jgi:hypothetical protein